MKTLCQETKNGTTASATEFIELAAAIRFMKEKKKQGYTATFPERIGNQKFIVYTWRKNNERTP